MLNATDDNPGMDLATLVHWMIIRINHYLYKDSKIMLITLKSINTLEHRLYLGVH